MFQNTTCIEYEALWNDCPLFCFLDWEELCNCQWQLLLNVESKSIVYRNDAKFQLLLNEKCSGWWFLYCNKIWTFKNASFRSWDEVKIITTASKQGLKTEQVEIDRSLNFISFKEIESENKMAKTVFPFSG